MLFSGIKQFPACTRILMLSYFYVHVNVHTWYYKNHIKSNEFQIPFDRRSKIKFLICNTKYFN